MKIKTKFILLLSLCITLGHFSCKKYLDEKTDSRLSTPNSIAELELILDNARALNQAAVYGNETADEYYLTTEMYESIPSNYQQYYLWDNIVENKLDWQYRYVTVLYCNIILDNLQKISPAGQQAQWDQVRAAALFHRAHTFFQLVLLFAKQYDPATAESDLGIPLRLNSNFNEPSTRATVQQCYTQIIKDLEGALPILPANPQYKTRPGKPAALGLLARVYLQMGNYTKAQEHATKCLEVYNELLDYNAYDPAAETPFLPFNQEVIFHAFNENSMIGAINIKTDSLLYRSYQDNDLRKTLYYYNNGDNTFVYKGTYTGAYYSLFQGIATDEIYLIRAECHARNNQPDAAMDDLNTLLVRRFKTGTFVPYTAANADQALEIILRERKKELVLRGLRWADLKRLNKEPRFAITLKRVIAGKTYTLPPNDPRYAFLIPREVITMAGITQNPR